MWVQDQYVLLKALPSGNSIHSSSTLIWILLAQQESLIQHLCEDLIVFQGLESVDLWLALSTHS